MVWIDVDLSDKVIRQSEKTTSLLVNAFGLKLAYGYARSCVSALQPFRAMSTGRMRSVNHFVSATLPNSSCLGIQTAKEWGGREATPRRASSLSMKRRRRLGRKPSWDNGVSACTETPCFPRFCWHCVIGGQIDLTTAAIKNDIRGVEKRTGYHKFASRQGEKRSEGRFGGVAGQDKWQCLQARKHVEKVEGAGETVVFIEEDA
ncbi:hypothetical protein J3459_006062 [Metarhizium acridum]|nr:hypothetical protein J3459_006062 [Metarhizium acridum]